MGPATDLPPAELRDRLGFVTHIRTDTNIVYDGPFSGAYRKRKQEVGGSSPNLTAGGPMKAEFFSLIIIPPRGCL